MRDYCIEMGLYSTSRAGCVARWLATARLALGMAALAQSGHTQAPFGKSVMAITDAS